MLLAEELALVAINPKSGRHAVGLRSQLNACLAGLLVAELLLDDVIALGDKPDRVHVTGRAQPHGATLAAATTVVIDKGPKLKAILSHMDRGLSAKIGLGTWDACVNGLADAGIVTNAKGVRHSNTLVQGFVRDSIVASLRVAVAGDTPLDLRLAALLSMTGPANLLEVVAPDRKRRGQARDRIDHALDGTELEAIGKTVRRLISDANAAAVGGATVAASG
ncbi:MAG TPA: GPP34 family phosphoprotein [Ilumatobacteraceae bacterium]|nr:GPP34 family phosphoprotein [Ilumatobacteraceae bacterium]